MATKVIKIEIPIETKDNTGPVVDNISEKMENLDSAAKKAQKSMENTVNSAIKRQKVLKMHQDVFLDLKNP